jgi:hypothetical protein
MSQRNKSIDDRGTELKWLHTKEMSCKLNLNKEVIDYV